MNEVQLTKTIILNAPRETVWTFLTDKDKLGTWFHPSNVNLSEGNDYTLGGTNSDGEFQKMCWGTVLEMTPPEKLKYTFTVKPLDGVMTTVTWLLEELSGATKVTLLHEGLQDAGEASMGLLRALDAGWDEHFVKLREAV